MFKSWRVRQANFIIWTRDFLLCSSHVLLTSSQNFGSGAVSNSAGNTIISAACFYEIHHGRGEYARAHDTCTSCRIIARRTNRWISLCDDWIHLRCLSHVNRLFAGEGLGKYYVRVAIRARCDWRCWSIELALRSRKWRCFICAYDKLKMVSGRNQAFLLYGRGENKENVYRCN